MKQRFLVQHQLGSEIAIKISGVSLKHILSSDWFISEKPACDFFYPYQTGYSAIYFVVQFACTMTDRISIGTGN
jgi:hypothetical protein